MAVVTDPEITGVNDGSGTPTYVSLTLSGASAGSTLQVTASTTKASSASQTWDGISWLASTLTLSGSTNVTTATGVNLFNIARPTITAGSALTVTNAATVYIANSPLAAGSATLTNVYSLWVDDGIVRIDGQILGGDGSAASPTYSFASAPTLGIYRGNSSFLAVTGATGTWDIALGADIRQKSAGMTAWTSSASAGGTVDVSLLRDAASTLALRTGTAAQTFRVYNTFTDASNYERLSLSGTTGTGLLIAAETAGTGADNLSLTLTSAGTSPISFGPGNAANGQRCNVRVATTSVSTTSGATVTATNLIPAGSFVIGVSVRVTTLIEGATSFDVGDGSDADSWGNDIAVAANTTTTIADFTAAGFGQFAAANNVVLTATGSDFTAGAVRITVYYIDLTAATS